MAATATTIESRRLAALHREGLLDTAPEPGFDAIVRAAARACAAPIALFNLVDADRSWSKAAVGQQQGASTPREFSPCAQAILHPGVRLEVADARADRRFAALPQVATGVGWRLYAGVPVRSDSGDAIGTLCVFDRSPRALTDAQRATLRELALALESLVLARRLHREASQTLAARDDESPAALLVVAPGGTIEAASGRWLAEFGRERGAVIGQPLAGWVAAASRDAFAHAWRGLVAAPALALGEPVATRLVGGNGALHDVSMTVHVDRDASGEPLRLRCAFVDVTAARVARDALALHERTDAMTGALSRLAFTQCAQSEAMRAQRHARPLSLVLFDPDRLRTLNERAGLGAGDEALAWIVAAAHEDLRVSDAIGRVAGAQFGILLPETPPVGAVHVAERLRSRVQAMAFGSPPDATRLTLSCGVTAFEPGSSVAQALSRAHVALRAAKAAGGNRTVVDASCRSTSRRGRAAATLAPGRGGVPRCTGASVAMADTAQFPETTRTGDPADGIDGECGVRGGEIPFGV